MKHEQHKRTQSSQIRHCQWLAPDYTVVWSGRQRYGDLALRSDWAQAPICGGNEGRGDTPRAPRALAAQRLVTQPLAISAGVILAYIHHGADTSLTLPFLQAVKPQLAIIAVGADYLLDHPHVVTLKKLQAIPTHRTDQQGSIEVVSDGEQYWVITER